MAPISELKSWFEKRRSQIKEDYFRFLKFKSVSTDPEYSSEMKACSDWLLEYLEKGGLNPELIQTATVPIVYAEVKSKDPKAKTVLAYGHYDVQPVDPIDLWESDPFEPTEREGKIFARGASDDKGQIFYAIQAAIALVDLGHPLPVNLKFCIEGEEECSSLGLTKALPKIKEKLKADSLLVVDFDQLEGRPAVTLGARGVAAIEVTLVGSNTDLHSGLMGGIAYNPNRALAELLSKLWNEKGEVQIPGFYDDVEIEDPKSYTYPYEKGDFAKDFAIEARSGEEGKSAIEANWLRPTLDINGMFGGYTGKGVKTVIPSSATAKITMRLVPNQRPDKILTSLAEYLKKNAKKGMKVIIENHGGESAWRGSPNSGLSKAVREAAEEATGVKCCNILSGGSIPVIADLMKAIGAEVAGMGYALPTDKIHAPNEHFDMKRFELGFLTFGRALAKM